MGKARLRTLIRSASWMVSLQHLLPPPLPFPALSGEPGTRSSWAESVRPRVPAHYTRKKTSKEVCASPGQSYLHSGLWSDCVSLRLEKRGKRLTSEEAFCKATSFNVIQ